MHLPRNPFGDTDVSYCCVVAVKQEKAELDRRESIEKFDKEQLKKTNTVEKNSLPDSQSMKWMDRLLCCLRS